MSSRYRLDLVLRPAEGALLRALGVATRRGYTPVAVDAVASEPDGRWQVRLEIDSARSPDQLARQLEKLYDCLSVEVVPCTP